MTSRTLTPPDGAVDELARLFQDHTSCIVSVREDRAFPASDFLSLGSIELFPQGKGVADYTRALEYGQFEWRTPDLTAATADIEQLLHVDELAPDDARLRAKGKVRRILDSVGAVPVHLGLSHPIFDPHALEAMPFRRPTTVVSDTSGVLQGGLSFVSEYLHPTARVKVPAIVQMEIVNLADRFLSIRRAPKTKPLAILRDHLNSQAGQRVLLQLELRSDVELERTFLLGDPLREAFKHDDDGDLKELNLSVPFRSYVDRLIVEAARRHQSQVAVGHPVTILTSDQGLARMAMAEGIRPLYFRATTAAAFFGRHLTGTNFHPFSGVLSFTSVSDVLWELATIFGIASLGATDTERRVTVHAIGDELTWAPYHSQDDLLWLELPANHGRADEDPKAGGTLPAVSPPTNPTVPPAETPIGGPQRPQQAAPTQTTTATLGRYKYSVDGLIRLVDRLDTSQELPVRDVMEILGVHTASGLKDYRRVLESGQAVMVNNATWSATRALSLVAIALRNADISGLRTALRIVPSYEALERLIREQPIGAAVDAAVFGRARSTFTALAEVTELGAQVYGAGVFATPTVPDDETFAEIATSAYDRLQDDGGWVATGRWLEELIVGDGIAPNIARQRLQTASGAGLIRRTTEGSTTETQYDRHTLKVLDVKGGVPFVKTEYLYRGDFLIPGKSSSSLRIERIEQ